MTTYTLPLDTVAIELTVDGADPPNMVKSLPASTVALEFSTAGALTRRYTIPQDTVPIELSTLSGSDDVVTRELLVGAGIELQVWDRADPQGTMLETLRFREQKFEVVLSETGAIEVTLPRAYLNSVLAEEDHHVVVLVDGVERARFLGEDLVEVPLSEDERQSVKLVGRGVGAILERGAIAPYDYGGPNQRVQRQWQGVTRAQALGELLGEIHARGTITDVVADGWNAVYGSTGQVWPDLVDLEFDAGGSYADLLDAWTEFGIEWLMTHDFRLQLAPAFGRDLSKTVVLYPAHTVRGQELSITRRDIRTVMFTQDGAGGVQTIEDPDAREKWGRREQYVVFSDALGAGTATANGYLLLALLKDDVKERRVEIDPNAPGRRPFVDFDLGDTVGVWFGDDVYEFRVLAIAMGADEDGRVRCEVTLEYILEAQRKRRQRLLNASSAGGGVSSGPQTVYAIGGDFVAGTSGTSITPLVIRAFVSPSGKVGFCIIGTCSTAQTVTVDLLYQETVIEQFQYTFPAGLQTVEATWLWTQIPQGEVPMRLRVRTDVGSFTVGTNRAQFWVEAKSISGKQTVAPVIFIEEEVPSPDALLTVTDAVDTLWTPPLVTGATLAVGETVPPIEDLLSVSDAVDGEWKLISTSPPSGADDGWVNASTLTTTGTSTYAGNVAGESRSAFYRFAISDDLTGKTIVKAYLVGIGNAVSAFATTELAAIDDADPAAPTTAAEYTGATLTTARRDWLTATTVGGSVQSPSILNIIQELQTSYGTMGHVVIFQRDTGSASGTYNQFRSQEYPAPVQLVIEYQEL